MRAWAGSGLGLACWQPAKPRPGPEPVGFIPYAVNRGCPSVSAASHGASVPSRSRWHCYLFTLASPSLTLTLVHPPAASQSRTRTNANTNGFRSCSSLFAFVSSPVTPRSRPHHHPRPPYPSAPFAPTRAIHPFTPSAPTRAVPPIRALRTRSRSPAHARRHPLLRRPTRSHRPHPFALSPLVRSIGVTSPPSSRTHTHMQTRVWGCRSRPRYGPLSAWHSGPRVYTRHQKPGLQAGPGPSQAQAVTDGSGFRSSGLSPVKPGPSPHITTYNSTNLLHRRVLCLVAPRAIV